MDKKFTGEPVWLVNGILVLGFGLICASPCYADNNAKPEASPSVKKQNNPPNTPKAQKKNSSEMRQSPQGEWVINHVGFIPEAPKFAYWVSATESSYDGKVMVVEKSTGRYIINRPLPSGKLDPHSQRQVHAVDLSSINTSGEYGLYLRHQGQQYVSSFSVAEEANQSLLKRLLRSYYLQRCGIAIDDARAEVTHAQCHREDATLKYTDAVQTKASPIKATGGWHDAGDYGKYAATTAVAVIEILSRYEQYPAMAKLVLDIPESNNQRPDILDEMRVGLDWLLTMQRSDGAVYRKLAGDRWPSIAPPDKDIQPRFVYGISTPETGKAVAAFALAARIYKAHDEALATTYLKAAKHSWQWLMQQGTMHFDAHEGDNSGSGPYMLNKIDKDAALTHHEDDKFAAALALYLTTHEKQYLDFVNANYAAHDLQMFEWKNIVSQPVMNALLRDDQHLAAMQKHFKAQLKIRVEQAMRRTKGSPFGLANHRFIWASNKMMAAEGILLHFAAHVFNEPRYAKAAYNQLNYLLGANALNKVFVTGMGEHSVQHVSHIYARAKKVVLPGLFVGGPNEMAQAGIAEKNKGSLSYADHGKSYATNEYAIDYNSTLIALLSDIRYRPLLPSADIGQ